MNINCCVVSRVFFDRMKNIGIDNYDLTAENDKLYCEIVLQIKNCSNSNENQ